MKILTNKQYREALAEEREKMWDRERIDRAFNEHNNRIWELERRVSELEGEKLDEVGMVKPI